MTLITVWWSMVAPEWETTMVNLITSPEMSKAYDVPVRTKGGSGQRELGIMPSCPSRPRHTPDTWTEWADWSHSDRALCVIWEYGWVRAQVNTPHGMRTPWGNLTWVSLCSKCWIIYVHEADDVLKTSLVEPMPVPELVQLHVHTHFRLNVLP